MLAFALRAKYVLPIEGPPIENAVVNISDGKIVAVEKARSARGQNVFDLGEVAVLPGFINAHTHLELTFLHNKVPYLGAFASWLDSVATQLEQVQDEEILGESIRRGSDLSLKAGVTSIANIGYGLRQVCELSAAPVRAICFMEVVGIGPKQHIATRSIAENLSGLKPDPPGLWLGLAPHAPYSTAPSVYRACLTEAHTRGWPVSTHLAETKSEDEFLQRGGGELAELLRRRGLMDQSITALGCSPVQFADRVGLLALGALLAHVNYIDDADLDRLARSPCSVAFCPCSHSFFQHEPHRFQEMLTRGINVCIGTDSLASNDSLSVLDELRFLKHQDPSLLSETLLEMATTRPARALGIDTYVGSLGPGKCADLVAIPIPSGRWRNPADALLVSSLQPTDVFVSGRRA